MKFYLRLYIFILLCVAESFTSGAAQTTNISVFVNGDAFPISAAWLDSAQYQSELITIRYNITGAHSYGSEVTTMIRLPQVLNVQQVIEQVLLYYFLIEEETAKNNEQLYIYPYFTEQDKQPSIRVRYQSGTLKVDLKEWKIVPRPRFPSPEEREIYNQIVEDFFNEVQEYNSMSNDRFQKIAQKNNIPVEHVRKIYEDVTLWNLTR